MQLVGINRQAAKTPIIGIDLGTTNSLVAYVDNGEPKIINSREGQRLLPSVVRFVDGRAVIGDVAKKSKVKDATHTVFSVKRLLGRGFSDVREIAAGLPYRIFEEKDVKDGVLKIEIDGRKYTAVEISALILKELKVAAEKSLGVPITKAVITVPAYFNDSQRQATRAAGRVAGLDVLRIINEPTAASLAYGLLNKKEGKIAVYDLGGGTFDISILKLQNGIFEVLSTNGNTSLGGDDLDNVIADRMKNEIIQSAGISIVSPEDIAALTDAAEKLKIAFSDSDEAVFRVELSGLSSEFVRPWTRDEFCTCLRPVLEKTRAPCELALSDASLYAADLSDVILVGGPTRLKEVREMVTSIFGRAPSASVHPDEVVAIGAAIQADILAGNNKDFLLLDVAPLSLGIETYGGLMSVLIPRNTRVPVSVKDAFTTFVDNQNAVDIHVLQGERERVEDNRSLARFKLKGIKPMPARMARIEVTFLIDADGILQVSAQDLISGKEQSIEVKPSHGLTDSEIDQMLIESAEYAESDVEYRMLVETRNHAEPILINTEKRLPDARRLLSAEEVKQIEGASNELRVAIEGEDIKLIREVSGKLDRLTRKLADIVVAEAIRKAENA